MINKYMHKITKANVRHKICKTSILYIYIYEKYKQNIIKIIKMIFDVLLILWGSYIFLCKYIQQCLYISFQIYKASKKKKIKDKNSNLKQKRQSNQYK